MPPQKKILQDIVPKGARSIRNIPLERDYKKPAPIPDPVVEDREPPRVPNAPPPPRPRTKPSKSRSFFTLILVVVSLVVIGVGVSIYLTKAEVTVSPRRESVNVSGTFTAKRTAGSGELAYDVLTITASSSVVVASTDGQLVETRSKGTVTLYNSFSPTPQKIVATTRLENAKGQIYRTDSTITIPGSKIVSGKTVPGSVSVKVTADKAGQEYNMSLSDLTGDFKVVAYAGSTKYNTIYGRIESNITGGFSGHKKIVEAPALGQARKNLEDSLRAKLVADARAVLPDGEMVYDNGYIVDFIHYEPVGSDPTKATVSTQATLSGVTFLKDSLARYIVKDKLSKFASIPYEVVGVDSLTFKIINTRDISPKSTIPLIFSLAGTVDIVGTLSVADLARDIAGMSFPEANKVFARYNGISSANISVTPTWWRTLPSNPDKISIILK